MTDERRVDRAHQQLDRVLRFFARVDAKISTLFAVNAGMLGVLAVNGKLSHLQHWHIGSTYIGTVVLLSISFWFLRKASYPNLDGGDRSLVYFKSIGERTETKYIEEATSLSEEQWEKELLGQIWRNSQILTEKFVAVKTASLCTGLALLPWFVGILLAAGENDKFIR